MVATVWMLSPLLPFSMFMRSNEVPWMPWAGSIIFILLGVSITQFRKQKIEEGTWRFTDTVAYIVIPSIFFLIFSIAAITSVQT